MRMLAWAVVINKMIIHALRLEEAESIPPLVRCDVQVFVRMSAMSLQVLRQVSHDAEVMPHRQYRAHEGFATSQATSKASTTSSGNGPFSRSVRFA